MSRQENVLSVFVASPNDVSEEREALQEVVRELNTTLSSTYGVRLDLIRWETDARPGIGRDAQDVINQQTPDDYDIFVGIFWTRFGTPTSRADSGTIEEFERAKARFDADPTSVKIMFYFKEEPINPSRIDPDQHKKVLMFRRSLEEMGVFYRTFGMLKDFEQLMRIHLSGQLRDWKSERDDAGAHDRTVSNGERAPNAGTLSLDDFKRFEVYRGELEELSQIFGRREKLMEETLQGLIERNAKLRELRIELESRMLSAARESEIRQAAERQFELMASDLMRYADSTESDLAVWSDARKTGLNSLIRIWMSLDLNCDDDKEAQRMLESITNCRETLASLVTEIIEWRESLRTMAGDRTVLQQAALRVIGTIELEIDEIKGAEAEITQFERAFGAKVRKHGTSQ